MKIITIADVPDQLAHLWLQHLRNFDAAHPGCHFDIAAQAPDMSTSAVQDILDNIEPPLPVRSVAKKQ